MAKTRTIQVTLDEEYFNRLTEMAHREGKKLAGIVREAVEKYPSLTYIGPLPKWPR